MNIVLCGLPACGKSTVGTLLSKKLKKKFIDTDRQIEKVYFLRYGKNLSCRQIYSLEGEPLFRSLESEQIKELQKTTASIIALGGGSVCDTENIKIIPILGCCIYLQASQDLLWTRIKKEGIPAYLDPLNPKKAFKNLANKRKSLYESIANLIIQIDHLKKEEIADSIIKLLAL